MIWHRIYAVVVVTVLFTGFDLLLFPLARDTVWLPWYRVLQTFVQLGLYGLAWWAFSWRGGWFVAGACALVWWTGGCDVLYYWLGGHPFWSESHWWWMWWTPLGIIRGGARIEGAVLMSACEVAWQAGIGLALGIIVANGDIIYYLIRDQRLNNI